MACAAARSIGWIREPALLPTRALMLGVACALAAACPAVGHAYSNSSGSSWSSQPSWAAPDPNTPPPTSRHKARDSSSEVSPFSPGSNNVSLDVGQVFLMGQLSSLYDNAIGTQLHYTYGVSDLFGFDATVGYSEHSNGNFSMITAMMGVRTNLAWYDKVVPYGVFGMGFYRPSYEIGTGPNGSGTPVESLTPLLFGVHLGPGVDLAMTKQVFFGASLVFNDIFGNTQMTAQNQPFSVGGTFTTFYIHAGVTF